MESFLQRHESSVTGRVDGFDRIRFRGTVRLLANTGSLAAVLSYLGILLKEFKEYAMGLTEQLKTASLQMALSAGRPVQYLNSSSIRKEDVAREIARRDNIQSGLICVLTAVEPCSSFHVRRDRATKKLPSWRKCLHLYHYFMHPNLGFMHARVQSWLPFNVPVCINGRDAQRGAGAGASQQWAVVSKASDGHRVNANSIKMYDKQGSVLRVETTINNTRDFKVFRAAGEKDGAAQAVPANPGVDLKGKWQRMRKGVADMHRRAQVCQSANTRYLQAMAVVGNTTPLKTLTEPLCQCVA